MGSGRAPANERRKRLIWRNQGSVPITRLTSGVQKLDDILGGGWPEYSFNLIVGEAGAGKTTLAHQFMFANATPERPALYFTVLGEPTIKMLRYQQQFAFFDMSKVGTRHPFRQSVGRGAQRTISPRSSTRSWPRSRRSSPPSSSSTRSARWCRRTAIDGTLSLQEFVQRLAMKLTTWQATTFLLGEYPAAQIRENPVFTMADGLLLMSQQVSRNSMVRQVQVQKMRGNAPQPGLHTIRISEEGVRAFPRMLKPIEEMQGAVTGELISTGIAGLDEMLGGGTLRGNAMLIAGPVGSGKSTTAVQFLAEGARLRRARRAGDLRGDQARSTSIRPRRSASISKQLMRRRAARGGLRPAARPVDGRNALRDRGGGRATSGPARRARFDFRARSGARAGVQDGFPRIAVPAAGRADRRRHHHPADRRSQPSPTTTCASRRTRSRS